MSLDAVLDLAEYLCCKLSVTSDGKIEIEGNQESIEALTPAVLASKQELIRYLQRPDTPSPGPCLICGFVLAARK